MRFESRIETLTEAHIEPYVRLSCVEYGSEAPVADPAHLRWKFLENPYGPSIGLHVYRGGELVGRLVAMSRRFVHRGRTYTAAQFVDLLVHPEHRGVTPILRLVDAFKQLSGFDFMLMVSPNQPEITEAFFKMPACFDLDVALVPLQPARLLGARAASPMAALAALVDWPWRLLLASGTAIGAAMRGTGLTAEWPSERELDELLGAAWEPEAIGLRTAAFLDWRFCRSPIFKYDVRFMRRAGRLTGYLVTRRSVYRGYDCHFVVDAFSRRDAGPRAGAGAMLSSLQQAALGGAEMAMVVGNTRCGPLAAAYTLPLVTVPDRFRPRNTTVYAKWLIPAPFAFSPEEFHLSLGDYDAF